MILTLVFMTVILGMAAAVVDVGAWYRTHRQMQNNADAAALAGATALPENTGQAASLATTYANRNGGGVTGADVSFSSKDDPERHRSRSPLAGRCPACSRSSSGSTR